MWFLDFEKFKSGLPELEEEESERELNESQFLRVLGAKDLKDLDDVPIESLAMVMVDMGDYINDLGNASRNLYEVISQTKKMKRVCTARLL